MYEGKIFQAGLAPLDAEAGFGTDGLRSLGWGELVARLGAARDFRRIMVTQANAVEGSFDTASAQHLAALGEGQRGINPFALTNGKMGQGKEVDVSSETMTGDRGMQ
jgi:hypothetical protein